MMKRSAAAKFGTDVNLPWLVRAALQQGCLRAGATASWRGQVCFCRPAEKNIFCEKF